MTSFENPPHLTDQDSVLVSAKAMQNAVADLQEIRPGPGLAKMAYLLVIFVGFTSCAFIAQNSTLFCLFSVASGMSIAAWIILSHDAIHHTLTGWATVDEIIPRIVSYPLIWVHGMYSEIHKLHHKMNGDDFRDPERVQWTEEEFHKASPKEQFYVKYQWIIDILVFAGFGMIYKTTAKALKFYQQSKSVRRAYWWDLIGILSVNIVIYSIAIHYGHGIKYLIFWLILERVTGGIIQWRAHIEHYGLWGKGQHYFATQAYNCRNLKTNKLMSWYVNHLNFHSVHHAFPRIPFYHLQTAHERIMALFDQPHVAGLTVDQGYLTTTLRLARTPQVISSQVASPITGQKLMINVD